MPIQTNRIYRLSLVLNASSTTRFETYLFFRSESWGPREARPETIWADPIEGDFLVGNYRIWRRAVLYLEK